MSRATKNPKFLTRTQMAGFVVDLGDLLAHPGDRRTISEEGELSGGTDLIHFAGPAVVEAVVESTGTGIIARGTVIGDVRLVCVRCLVDWDQNLTPEFMALFEETEDPDIYPIADGRIDLEPVVRDELLSAVPVNALHDPDCKGLCGTCGADLNKGGCGCPETELSSPFAGLKDLLDVPESQPEVSE
jgi:uncharacterized protein